MKAEDKSTNFKFLMMKFVLNKLEKTITSPFGTKIFTRNNDATITIIPRNLVILGVNKPIISKKQPEILKNISGNKTVNPFMIKTYIFNLTP